MTADGRSSQDRRAGDRRGADRRAGSAGRALVPVSEVRDETAAPAADAAARQADRGRDRAAGVAVAAQMIGQTGARRGLKGGSPVLDAARSAYLEAEFSGPGDRRPRAGGAHRTDV